MLDEACLRRDHLWSRMDHLLSAGYLVDNQVSTSSFSTTHLLTFANHQPEQVRIHSHDGLNTFVSGRRGTVVHHNFEVSLNNYLFALHLVSGTAASTVITRLTRSPTTTRTPSSSTSRFEPDCQRSLANIAIVIFIAIVSLANIAIVHFQARDPCPECGKQIANLSQHLRLLQSQLVRL